MARDIENINIENAKLVFRNFSGKPDKFNPNGGNRQFSVVIDDPAVAADLKDEGWNIKGFRPKEGEEGDPGSYLQVKVSFKSRPPHIYICTKRSKVLLTEETVGSLDYADISGADIVITPYKYDVRGQQGVAAYVKTMYVNVIEDEFASKYQFDNDADELPFD